MHKNDYNHYVNTDCSKLNRQLRLSPPTVRQHRSLNHGLICVSKLQISSTKKIERNYSWQTLPWLCPRISFGVEDQLTPEVNFLFLFIEKLITFYFSWSEQLIVCEPALCGDDGCMNNGTCILPNT